MHDKTMMRILFTSTVLLLAISDCGLAQRYRSGGNSGRRGQTAQDRADSEEALRNLDALVEKVRQGERPNQEDIRKVVSGLSRVAWTTEEPQPLLEKLQLLGGDEVETLIPTPETPLGDNQLARLIVSLQIRQMKDMPAEQTQVHPAAAFFPGAVPATGKRVTRKITVTTSAAGWHNDGIYGNPRSPYWHSTGLYAAPGEIITVDVPENMTDKGLAVRIGAHSDRLYRKTSWSRMPDICRTFALEQTTTKAANAFGGLVYIETPPESNVGVFDVAIAGAVEAPYYILGETDVDDWRASIRLSPVPWAELATDKVVLTLPSEVVRELDAPDDVMRFWDGIMDCYADLLGRERQRRRAERFVSDVQISAGYMHSGYPLMTMLDITATMVDIKRIRSNGHHGVWGLFHEIGHNHQNSDWTYRGTTEVTVNLFSLYVMEHVCGLVDSGHPSIRPEVRSKKITAYLEAGADFEQWKQDPFLALAMYMQMKQAFGWDPFTKVFAQYRDLGPEERPQSDDEKRDQWMVRFSRTVGRNLGPFFQTWGVPTSEEARKAIAGLPQWMPEGFPPEIVNGGSPSQ